MARATGQNSLTPSGEQNSLAPYGNNNLNSRLARDQVVHHVTAANLCVSRPDIKKPLKSGNVSHKRRHSLFKKRD